MSDEKNLRRRMDEAVSKGDYIRAGEFQKKLKELEHESLNARMEEAVSNQDYILAGDLQRQLRSLQGQGGNVATSTADAKINQKRPLGEKSVAATKVGKVPKSAKKTNKKRKSEEQSSRAPSGLAKPVEISNQLANFLGKDPNALVARTQIVKETWAYIKANNLQQNPSDRREIYPDKKMEQVFGRGVMTPFTMNKLLNPHIYPFKPADLTTKKNKPDTPEKKSQNRSNAANKNSKNHRKKQQNPKQSDLRSRSRSMAEFRANSVHLDDSRVSDSYRRTTLSQLELEVCNNLVEELKSEKYGKWNKLFLFPFNMDVVPGYFDVCERAIDLSTLSHNIESGCYSSRKQVYDDCNLIFENAIKYHSDKDDTNYIAKAAEYMLKVAKRLQSKMEAKIAQKEVPSNASGSLVTMQSQSPMWEELKAGSRVGVYWEQDKCYYPGTITERHDVEPSIFLVKYDDGEEEWTDMAKENFCSLTNITPKYIGTTIEPNQNDVIYVQGEGTEGNTEFRSIILSNRTKYQTAKKAEKTRIAASIVNNVRSMKPRGRFLMKEKDNCEWFDIGDEEAIKKVQNLLQEKEKPMQRLTSHITASIVSQIESLHEPGMILENKISEKETPKKPDQEFQDFLARW